MSHDETIATMQQLWEERRAGTVAALALVAVGDRVEMHWTDRAGAAHVEVGTFERMDEDWNKPRGIHKAMLRLDNGYLWPSLVCQLRPLTT